MRSGLRLLFARVAALATGLRLLLAGVAALAILSGAAADEELGRFSANPFDPESTGNPLGAGSPHKANGINNPLSPYGSIHDNRSANNKAATDPPKLYDDQGHYRGRLSANPHHPDSIANPNGRFGSRHSPESVNNPSGLGHPLRTDSPANPRGRGLRIVGSSAAGTPSPDAVAADSTQDGTAREEVRSPPANRAP